jgi:uncharacterized membrane protein required for colicin V production
VNPIDLSALALMLAFGYRGYRTGLISVVLGLTGGLLAFGLAAALAPVLAPAVTPVVSDFARLPDALVRPALVIGLTFALRFVLGYALRELGGVLRLLLNGVPPLAVVDRLLGIVPMATIGALLALAAALLALNLPLGGGVRGPVERSWLARDAISHPHRTLDEVRDLAARLLTEPPRVNGYILAFGIAGLGVATLASGRLRGPARAAAQRRSSGRRGAGWPAGSPVSGVRARGGSPPASEAELPDPLLWLRAVLGVGVALLMAAGLMFFIALR